MKRSDEHPSETTSSGVDTEPLEELLRHARQDGFTPEETGEIWKRLGAVLGAPSQGGGPTSPAGGSASGAGATWSAKTVAALVLGGGAIVAGGLVITGVAGLAWHRAAPAVSTGSRVAGTEDRGPPSTVENFNPPPSPPGSSPRTDAPSRSAGLRRPLTKAGQPRAGMSATESAPESTGTTEATPSAPPSPPSDPGPNEGALLLHARRELGSNPTETLKLTEQHARLFPTGTLAPEREVLAIEALAQLGRLSEARARVAAFRARFPQSAHLARLEAIVDR